MSQFEQSEIDHYEYGSSLWAGQNDPVLVVGVNDEVFWDSFLSAPGGKAFARLDCEENRAILLRKYAERNSGLIVRSALTQLWNMLLLAHSLDFVDPQAEAVEEEVVSPEQEYAAWMDGKSEFQIRERRASNKGFSTWFTATNKAQIQSDDMMADQNYRNNIRTEKANTSQALRDWAAEFHRTSVQESRRLASPSTNPAGYTEWNRNFQSAMNAGLI